MIVFVHAYKLALAGGHLPDIIGRRIFLIAPFRIVNMCAEVLDDMIVKSADSRDVFVCTLPYYHWIEFLPIL